MSKYLAKRIRECEDPAEKGWLKEIKAEMTQSLEAIQFLACEGIKVLRFVIGRSDLYLRHKDKALNKQHIEQDMEIENEMSEGEE